MSNDYYTPGCDYGNNSENKKSGGSSWPIDWKAAICEIVMPLLKVFKYTAIVAAVVIGIALIFKLQYAILGFILFPLVLVGVIVAVCTWLDS